MSQKDAVESIKKEIADIVASLKRINAVLLDLQVMPISPANGSPAVAESVKPAPAPQSEITSSSSVKLGSVTAGAAAPDSTCHATYPDAIKVVPVKNSAVDDLLSTWKP